jgi:3-oxoacyl-[acyl-carrier protein] reductase
LYQQTKGAFMSLPLEQKSALVTGSSRGIGRAVAERLALDGAAVVINYTRSRQQAEEAMDSIAARGGRAIAIQADISKPADVRRLFDEAEQALGCLDIVVANAGVFLEKPLTESTEEDYDYVFNINTRGVFFTLQEAARRVRDGVASSPFRPGARRCSLPPTPRCISAAKRRSSNSSARSRARSGRATLR